MQIAIIGLGGIGASIGLGLATEPSFKRLGYDVDPQACEGALTIGAIDRVAKSLAECACAEIIVLATPPASLPSLMQALGEVIPPHTLLTDTASVKAPVLAWARQFLPNPAQFVGGHPIAGTEHHGWRSARADLFHEAQWVLTPIPETPADALERIAALVRALGATPVVMTAQTHDEEVALLSHLPHILAFSLHSLGEQFAPELQGGGSWHSATRVARSDPELWSQILTLNREAVLNWLARLHSQLDALEAALHTGDSKAVYAVLCPPTRRAE